MGCRAQQSTAAPSVALAKASSNAQLSRRHHVCLLTVLLLGATSANAEPQAEYFVNKKQKYQLKLPQGWTQKQKAGADALFENPQRKSSNLGVTVAPVRVKALQDFGDIDTVADKLLSAETNKESTLDAKILSSDRRYQDKPENVIYYVYEYELNSTRGRKRILNTVTIKDAKLYIVNAQHKCGKEACTDEDEKTVDELRKSIETFELLPADA